MIMNMRKNDQFKDIEFAYFVQYKLQENIRKITRYNDRWNFKCPICGDSQKNSRSKRGWYYIKTNSYYCWNGGCAASEQGLPILKVLSLVCHQSMAELKLEYLKSLGKTSKKIHKKEEVKVLPKQKVELLDSWIPIDDNIQKYIEHRRILEAPFAPKNWQFYFDKKKKRLVIPWNINGKLKSYQLRAIYKNQTPKYLFPFNVDKPVFGIDNVDESFPYIFGLEGAFDSIWVKNGVAIGGLTPTENQINSIKSKLCDYVYMFDNQWADETSMKKSIKLATDDPYAKIFIWPHGTNCKDVNEFVIKQNKNPFVEKTFLKKHIYSGVRALLVLNII